jgi:hypothetical protein
MSIGTRAQGLETHLNRHPGDKKTTGSQVEGFGGLYHCAFLHVNMAGTPRSARGRHRIMVAAGVPAGHYQCYFLESAMVLDSPKV